MRPLKSVLLSSLESLTGEASTLRRMRWGSGPPTMATMKARLAEWLNRRGEIDSDFLRGYTPKPRPKGP